jgi:hypothetical protein
VFVKLEWQVVDDSNERLILVHGTTTPGDNESLRNALVALVKLHHPTAHSVAVTLAATRLDVDVDLTPPPTPPQPDTLNRFAVGGLRDAIVVLKDVRGIALSNAQALNLAAWLVALADEDGAFDRLLAAVKAT